MSTLELGLGVLLIPLPERDQLGHGPLIGHDEIESPGQGLLGIVGDVEILVGCNVFDFKLPHPLQARDRLDGTDKVIHAADGLKNQDLFRVYACRAHLEFNPPGLEGRLQLLENRRKALPLAHGVGPMWGCHHHRPTGGLDMIVRGEQQQRTISHFLPLHHHEVQLQLFSGPTA